MSSKTFSPAWLERHRVRVAPVPREAIVGLSHVMTELSSLVGRLSDAAGAAALGAPLPRGVLFHGEPGTGKTLVARFLASSLESGVPLYELGADELSAARLRGAMRHLSAAHERSVVFLDEIDQWAMSRDSPYHDPDTRLVLTGALAALDGLESASGVLVIAASNHGPESLDPALVRAGRLGIHIEFGVPDEHERVDLLGRTLRERPTSGDIDLRRLAALSRGRTPAALVGMVDDAAGLALARGARTIEQADLVSALRRSGGIDAHADLLPSERFRVAVHEAGHTCVALTLRGAGWVHAVRVDSRGGRTEIGPETRRHGLLPDDEMQDLAIVAMAGFAAEREVLGSPSLGGSDDIATATMTGFERITSGIEPGVPPIGLSELRQYLPGSLKRLAIDAIAAKLESARTDAARIVAERGPAIERFARLLDASGELVGAELAAAISESGLVALPLPDAG